MRCGVIARKLGMSRVFNDKGEHVSVTVLRLEDVEVLSTRSVEKDGYLAVQLGFNNKKLKNVNKPLKGFFAKANTEPKEKVVEFRVSENALLKIGDKISVNHFIPGQKIDVAGITQGKGFAGSMKRHNFGGMQATHGVSISHRAHGSTGNSQDPGRTWKGKKMAGQYGSVRVTTQNLKVVKLIDDDNLILIEGSVPGSRNGIVTLTDAVKHNLPSEVPFPAGLKKSESSDDIKNEIEQASEVSVKTPENEGAQVDN